MLKLSRPLILLFSALTYMLGAGVGAYLGRATIPAPFWIGLVFIIASQLSMNWLSEVFRPYNEPLIDGEEPKQKEALRKNLLNLSIALLAVNAVMTFLLYLWHDLGGMTAVFFALSLIIVIVTSIHPFRLIDRGFGELAVSVHVAYIIPTIGFLLQNERNHPLLIWLTAPLTFLALAYFLVDNLISFSNDQKYERSTMLRGLTWERAIPFHHLLLIAAYLIFVLAPMSGYPLIWQAFLTVPFAIFQIFQMREISLGGTPNWKLLRVTAIAVFGLTAYFLALTFWMR